VSRVQSVERAFAVLGSLADGPLGVTEVADRASLPKSTAARLLASLAREGAVEQEDGGTRYRLGSRIASLAAGLVPARSLVTVARPVLVELASAVGEAAGLSVPDGTAVHYVDQVDTTHQVQVRDWTGTRAPMHAVSSGQVFLAHYGEAALERYLAQPRIAFTSATLVDSAALRARLRRAQVDGYAWVREEFAEGLNSVAAGVAGIDGEIVAAVHIHGPAYRFPPAEAEEPIASRVVTAAALVSTRLRGQSG
jgi:DNA-binding IclR family transcriptional regulator